MKSLRGRFEIARLHDPMIGVLESKTGGGPVAIAIPIAISRVNVGLDHPVDVLESAVIAVGAVSAAYTAFKELWHKEVI
jgi:membrane-associated phospholipid phosphatase